MSNTNTPTNSKVKIVIDHNGKPCNPKYGYVVNVIDCATVEGGVFTEKGMQTTGIAHLIQTSWCSGALWYSTDALRPATGAHKLNEWKKKMQDYHNRQK